MTSTIWDAKTDYEKTLFDNFVKKKVCKSLYSSKKHCFITTALRAELDYMLQIVSNLSLYIWEAPIAQRIPREADYHSWGDASLHAAGGFSLDLDFWCYIS